MFRTAVLLFSAALAAPFLLSPAQNSKEQDPASVQRSSDKSLAKPDQDISAAEREIVTLTPEFGKEQGRLPLKPNAPLQEAAREFAEFLAKTDRFSHEADGKHPWDRAKKHGYDYCIVLENIGMEFRSDGFTTDELAKALVEGWKNSPGHRKNMVDPDVMDIGIGVAHSDQTGKYFGVQMFGRPESEHIVFQVSNRSGVRVRVKLDDKMQTLEDHTTGTFTRCRPPALALEPMSGETPNAPVYHPRNGSHFVIEK